MLDRLTVDSFTPAVGGTFVLSADGLEPLEIELVEARPQVADAPAVDASGTRAPFSLTFRGPVEPALPQRIYRVEHDAVGMLEIFVVPVGRDAAGTLYQAVFG
jgi:hypothetical protein